MIVFFPHFLVRFGGFSFSRLKALRFEGSVAALELSSRAAHECEVARDGARAAIDAEVAAVPHDSEELAHALRHAIKKARTYLKKGGEVLPSDALSETARLLPRTREAIAAAVTAEKKRRELEQSFRDAFARELEAQRTKLRAMFTGDERLREAIFLESAAASVGIDALLADDGARDARAKKRERMAVMYLQRFCAKNDTNSMCGPFALGHFAEGGAPLTLRIEDELAHRASYFAYWGAERLHRALAERCGRQATLRLRRNPTAHVSETAVEWCSSTHDATSFFKRTYARAAAGEEMAAVLEALAAPKTTKELVEELGEEIEELIEQLLEVDLILESPSIPVGLYDPLSWVLDDVATWPIGQEADALRSIRAAVQAFAAAPLARRKQLSADVDREFERMANASSHRAQGQHYADRALIYEDCFAEMSAELGVEAFETPRRAIDLLAGAVVLPFELARENVRCWFAEKLGAGRRVSVLEAHREFDRATPYALEAGSPRAVRIKEHIARVRSVIEDAVASAKDRAATIDPRALEAALAGAPELGRAGHANVDLLVAKKRDGSLQWIVGEMHGFFMLPTTRLEVIPPARREPLVSAMRELLSDLTGGARTAQPIFLHTQATDRSLPLASHDLMMIGMSPRAEAVELGGLELMLDGDVFRFYEKDQELVPVLPYRPYPFFLYTTAFAPLIDEFADRFFPASLLPAEHGDLPRLSIGDVVFHRASKRWSCDVLRERFAARQEHELLAELRRFSDELGLGRQVFVSVTGEPKPVLLDFDAFFSGEAFAHLIKQAQNGAVARFSEMLPGPDELLLEGPDGPRTFELRLALYRRSLRS